MNLFFANPWGWLGLAALAPLVHLHFFRRQSRRRSVTTLFLVREASISRQAGNRFERWRRSLSFWLQAAAIGAISMLLAQPRMVSSERVATVVFCLDASYSMNAFRESAAAQVRSAAEMLERRLPRIVWSIMDTVDEGRALYRGDDLDEALQMVSEWRATLGTHDLLPSVRAAIRQTEGGGAAILLTDRPVEDLPPEAHLLAVGEAIENLGLGGIQALEEDGQRLWRATLRNYGAAAREATWWVETPAGNSEERTLAIDPGAIATLQGRFPESADSLIVRIGADGFEMDNVAPVVFPRPKRITVDAPTDSGSGLKLIEKLVSSVPGCVLVSNEPQADALARQTADLSRIDFARPGIVLLREADAEQPLLAPDFTVSNHPYTKGLSFDGLLLRSAERFAADPTDRVLLWHGSAPVLFLRGEQLVVNFDPSRSNADRLPGFVLLLYRYLERQRQSKVAPEAGNVDIGQRLAIAWPSVADQPSIETAVGVVAIARLDQCRAPDEPGFFEVAANGAALFTGAAQFADARESDFRSAARVVNLNTIEESVLAEYYERDFFETFWALGLGALMLGNWFACYRENL